MKIFDIFDEENSRSAGTLCCFGSDFIIELCPDLDEWNAPLLFTGFVRKGIYTIPRDISLLWVRERIVPLERQNIGAILRNHKMKEYDELRLLELSGGKCSQDRLCIRKLDTLPSYVSERMKKNLTGAFVSDENSLICFFADGSVKRVDLRKLEGAYDTDKVLSNKQLLESGHMGSGGFFITFNESIDVPTAVLYDLGAELNVKKEEFLAFAKKNLLDTTETCEALSCSRQNVAYLVKQKALVPIKEGVKGNLYLREDVLKNK